MSKTPFGIDLTDRGISQVRIYEKSVSIQNNGNKIVLSFKDNEDYHIFKLDKKESNHLLSVLAESIKSIKE